MANSKYVHVGVRTREEKVPLMKSTDTNVRSIQIIVSVKIPIPRRTPNIYR